MSPADVTKSFTACGKKTKPDPLAHWLASGDLPGHCVHTRYSAPDCRERARQFNIWQGDSL